MSSAISTILPILKAMYLGRRVIAIALVGSTIGLGLGISKAYSEPPPASESLPAREHAFLPMWKLLKGDAKQQFVAGYLFGWRDAAKVTDVAIEYVQQNPHAAVAGLERVRGLYEMEGLTAESIVRELDAYFSESGSRDATLSQAITTVRGRLGR